MEEIQVFVSRGLVRETGYNLFLIMKDPPLDDTYSRASTIYKEACKLLRLLDPLGAEEFINSTWKGQ